MYRLRRAYPRYSMKLGLVFLAFSSAVCALCLHIIESAKGVQLKYMKSAFSDCSSPLAAPDFDMEALDTYAATNLLAKMIDNKPRLVSREKKKVLAHYVSRVTHSDTGIANTIFENPDFCFLRNNAKDNLEIRLKIILNMANKIKLRLR